MVAKPISRMKRDLQNETASPNSKRALQIHNYGFSVCVYEFGDRVRVWEIAFHFGDRFGTYGPPYYMRHATAWAHRPVI